MRHKIISKGKSTDFERFANANLKSNNARNVQSNCRKMLSKDKKVVLKMHRLIHS